MRGPRSSALFVSLLLAGGIGLAGQQQAPAQPPAGQPPPQPSQSQVFRGGVELVSLNVTVMDGAKYVTDLTQDDFEAALPTIAEGSVASHEYTQEDAIAAIKANMK